VRNICLHVTENEGDQHAYAPTRSCVLGSAGTKNMTAIDAGRGAYTAQPGLLDRSGIIRARNSIAGSFRPRHSPSISASAWLMDSASLGCLCRRPLGVNAATCRWHRHCSRRRATGAFPISAECTLCSSWYWGFPQRPGVGGWSARVRARPDLLLHSAGNARKIEPAADPSGPRLSLGLLGMGLATRSIRLNL
jgi:hypothetical protein